QQVSVASASEIWGSNSAGNLYRWLGSSWEQVPGNAPVVSVSPSVVPPPPAPPGPVDWSDSGQSQIVQDFVSLGEAVLTDALNFYVRGQGAGTTCAALVGLVFGSTGNSFDPSALIDAMGQQITDATEQGLLTTYNTNLRSAMYPAQQLALDTPGSPDAQA